MQHPQPAQTLATVDQLLIALNLKWLDPSQDTVDQIIHQLKREQDIAIYKGKRLDSRPGERINSLVHEPRFTSWFQGTNSQILVVNDMDSSMLNDMISPLTYLCAKLTRSVSTIPSSHPLSFFCRMHCEQSSLLGGISGMLSSLITQLILHCGVKDSYIPLKLDEQEGVTDGDLTILARLFVDLLQQQRPPFSCA